MSQLEDIVVLEIQKSPEIRAEMERLGRDFRGYLLKVVQRAFDAAPDKDKPQILYVNQIPSLRRRHSGFEVSILGVVDGPYMDSPDLNWPGRIMVGIDWEYHMNQEKAQGGKREQGTIESRAVASIIGAKLIESGTPHQVFFYQSASHAPADLARRYHPVEQVQAK
ncbi:MAG: hypothetical protein Q7R76_02555 [Candidatus Woesearchaeota archaeon]|nr:hypothetical protein [Candidatus Woesearchaeota archaeon]